MKYLVTFVRLYLSLTFAVLIVFLLAMAYTSVNPYKLSNLSVGQRKTVQTQIRLFAYGMVYLNLNKNEKKTYKQKGTGPIDNNGKIRVNNDSHETSSSLYHRA